jgi:hypothetical protein
MNLQTEWIVILLSMNVALAMMFFSAAWGLGRLRRQVSSWADNLAGLNAELASVLSSQPQQLRSLVTTLQRAHRLYVDSRQALKNGWQVFIIVRFVVNRSMRVSASKKISNLLP